MSKQNTVTINDEEYDFDGLDVSTQANIARVNEIRREVAALKMQTNERELILQAYARAIVESVKPAEEAEVEAS